MNAAEDTRVGSWRRLEALGVPAHPDLPLLEDVSARSEEEVARRVLVLSAATAVAFGLDPGQATAWLRQERLADGVRSAEGSEEDVETLWALLWALRRADHLEPTRFSDDDMVDLLPDLRVAAPAGPFRASCALREEQELVEALDLLYCLHWASRARLIDRQATRVVPEWALRRRRHALEWVLHPDEPWDEMTLDT